MLARKQSLEIATYIVRNIALFGNCTGKFPSSTRGTYDGTHFGCACLPARAHNATYINI